MLGGDEGLYNIIINININNNKIIINYMHTTSSSRLRCLSHTLPSCTSEAFSPRKKRGKMSVVPGEGSIDDSGTEEDIFYSDDEEYIYMRATMTKKTVGKTQRELVRTFEKRTK